MTLKERYSAVLDWFAANNPEAETELRYTNPFELLVAVVLSAQCTDKRVNMVTPPLFERFPDAYALSRSDFDELFPYIKSISYPNNKTKHLLGLAQMLVERFNGEVPESLEDLVKLPGVGRKTANVIASVVFDRPAMAVDTHVMRVSKRLGLVGPKAKTPLEIEKTLIKHIPESRVARAHHWLILHGRYVCTARNPKCSTCQITAYCKYFSQLEKKKKQSTKGLEV